MTGTDSRARGRREGRGGSGRGIAGRCKAGARSVAGKTTLGELAALLSRSSLHLGVDSAAPHIANAVGTPTVTIFGPSDWRGWAIPDATHRVVCPDDPCVPCHKKGCDHTEVSLCLDNMGRRRSSGRSKKRWKRPGRRQSGFGDKWIRSRLNTSRETNILEAETRQAELGNTPVNNGRRQGASCRRSYCAGEKAPGCGRRRSTVPSRWSRSAASRSSGTS